MLWFLWLYQGSVPCFVLFYMFHDVLPGIFVAIGFNDLDRVPTGVRRILLRSLGASEGVERHVGGFQIRSS